MGYSTSKDETLAFASRIAQMGFAVYIAKSGTYGFITDASESRVLSFSFADLSASLSGNYGPPSRESGTGWRMDESPLSLTSAAKVHEALYAQPPSWSRGGWKRLTTVAEHLAHYGPSSQFTRFEA